MKKIVLWPNPARDVGCRVSMEVAALCREAGVEAALPDTLADALPEEGRTRVRILPLEEALKDADCLLALGGDGTILHLAKQAAQRQLPLLGINLGRLGFLAELEVSELPLLREVLAGRFTRDLRMMLDVSICRGETVLHTDLALNDAVLTGDDRGRFLSVRVLSDGQPILSFPGDGVIVSTPTGSTAYSLSAGGPIVEPEAESIAVTPICAHLPGAKAVVLAAGRTVSLWANDKPAVLVVDGRPGLPLAPGAEVRVRRSDRRVTLLRVKPHSFYEALDRKFRVRR
ncbi:MAG: NAD(+)/NADH kinase [Oscillospiraceae bacterium]|jgi:NAD+ kinase|nr:NAD(+)/NADH kinase [Oscillospiraceae bacterium]